MFLRTPFLLLVVCCIKCIASTDESEKEGRQLFPFRRQDDLSGRRSRPCTTPGGGKGFCQDVSRCPELLLDLGTLVRSICFQSLFRPGTCCPVEKKRTKTTTEATTTTESTTVSSTASTKKQTGFVKVTTPSKTKTTTTTTTSKPSTTKKPKNKDKKTTESTTSTSTTSTTTTTEKPSITSGLRPPPAYPELPSKPASGNRYGCGEARVTQARIVNGTESYPGQWPWMAAISLHGFLGSEFHCGGTVISRRYVITAAHCMIDKRGNRFSPSQFSVRLGDSDISTFNDRADKYVKTYKVESIRVHKDFENFNHQYFRNDIALMRLTRPIEFSPFIMPICLPSKAMSRAPVDSLSGEISTVIGYGRTSYSGPQSKRLLKAEMPVWWNKACDDAYFPPILETNVCAGYVEGGIDSCQGDSGGPLLIVRHKKWVLLGIVSFGQKCAEPGFPGVYTRIPKFLEWIKKYAKD